MYKKCAGLSRDDLHSEGDSTTEGEGNDMARGKRIDGQRESETEVDAGLRDLLVFAESEDGLIVESGTASANLNLGHASLQIKCWTRSSGMGSWSFRSELAALLIAPPRVPRPPRSRTPRHRSRPQHKAEARITPADFEILTD